jgi:hypothetical protein
MAAALCLICPVLSTPVLAKAKDEGKAKTGAPAADAVAATATDAPDEISDSSGRITKGRVTAVNDKEIIYKDLATGEEKKIATDNAIFVRSGKGEYRFFFPPEQPAAADPPAKPAPAPSGEFEVTAGVGGHFADNADMGDYVIDYGVLLAKQYNQKVGTGFSSVQTREPSSLNWQFFIEPRLNYESFILGLSIGYASIPKTSSVVSSAGDQIQTTVALSGTFFPVTAMFYYRLVSDGALGVNLGIGAGVLYSSVRLALTGGPAADEQILTGLNPILVFKPEVTYKFGIVRILLSVPVYWAEGKDVTDGESTLIQINSANIVSPRLTGVGVMLAAGIRL